ncbi:MAG TPA: glutaredoxin family protein [Terriglobia bacterium]|nr:glutaredoxin family protein [Terriglobia bacterium]
MNRKIRMYTTSWCVDCRRAKWFLKERNIPYEEINIEEVDGAEQFVTAANEGKRRVPTFDVNGRIFHCSPYDPAKLSRELELE